MMVLNQSRVARQSNWVAQHLPRSQRSFSRLHARLYEITGGRFLTRWFAGAPVAVLQTVGRRTGRKCCAPVLYMRDGDAFVVLAANAGASRTPAWWHNLNEAGEGRIVVGRRRMSIRPRILAGTERDRPWRAFVEMYPQAKYYAQLADRELPLIALEPG